MKFENAIKVISESKRIVLYVDTGTAYGELHDFLLNVKGIVVDRINQANEEEKAATEKVKEADAKKAEEAKNEVAGNDIGNDTVVLDGEIVEIPKVTETAE